MKSSETNYASNSDTDVNHKRGKDARQKAELQNAAKTVFAPQKLQCICGCNREHSKNSNSHLLYKYQNEFPR
jgi:hypothetical protein